MAKSQLSSFLSGNAIDGGWGSHLSSYFSLGRVQLLRAPSNAGAVFRGPACRWDLMHERRIRA